MCKFLMNMIVVFIIFVVLACPDGGALAATNVTTTTTTQPACCLSLNRTIVALQKSVTTLNSKQTAALSSAQTYLQGQINQLSSRVAALENCTASSCGAPSTKPTASPYACPVNTLVAVQCGGSADVESYSYGTNTWSPMAPISFGRTEGAAAATSTRIYSAGGFIYYPSAAGPTYLRTFEFYSCASKSWTPLPPMSNPRGLFALVAIPSYHKVYALGGFTFDPASKVQTTYSICEAYDETSNTWDAIKPMASSRSGHAAVIFATNTVVVLGGFTSLGQYSNTAEQFNPQTGIWSVFPSFSQGRMHLSATAYGNKIFVAGGLNGANVISTLEIYTAGTGWAFGSALPSGRWQHGAGFVSGNLVLVGGVNSTSAPQPIISYNPALNTWSATPLASPLYPSSCTFPSVVTI